MVPRVEPRVLTEYAEDRRPVLLPKVLPILENVPPMSRRTPEHSESETETSSGCLKRRKGLRFLIKELVDGDFVALLLVGADATDLVPGDMGDAGGVDRARDRENILSSLRADISSLFNLLRRGMMR